MAKYQMRKGYVFIGTNMKPIEGDVFDDTHPMFDSQRWKFEPHPLTGDETLVVEKEEDAPPSVSDLTKMRRPSLIALYKKLFDEDPEEGVTASALRELIEAHYAEQSPDDEDDEE